MTYWTKRCQLAQKRGHFTEKDKNDAADWQACAIDERRHELGMTTALSPTNERAWRMGLAFYQAVDHDDAATATEVVNRIGKLKANSLTSVSLSNIGPEE